MKADVKNNISKYVFYVLVAIALVILLAFVFKFNVMDESDKQLYDMAVAKHLSLPLFTDWVLYACYGFTALAAILIVCFMAVRYAKSWVESPKAAVKSSLPALLLIVLVVVCWVMGDSSVDTVVFNSADMKAAVGAVINPADMVRLTPDQKAIAESLPFNLQLTDAVLYAQYVLVGLAVLTTGVSLLIGALKNKNK